MNYAQIRKYDIANGEGVRTTLFVSGCPHHCKGCFNEQYNNYTYGNEWTNDTQELILSYLEDENIKGLSLLGGEVFAPNNVKTVTHLAKEVKKRYPNKDIWVWTGYTFEEILEDWDKMGLLIQCDILIDGRFVESLKDITLKFRGSSNQRIIDIKKSIEKSKAVLKKGEDYVCN